MDNRIVVVAGPTASGKTRLGIELAQALGGEIVSADSMQIYRRMDIGTAKATKEERAAAVHHMLDVADPAESWSVARYVEEATRCCDDIIARGRLPIVVGGTGLYIDSLISGLDFADSTSDNALRDKLGAEYDSLGGDAMLARLAQFDPERAAKLHPGDKRRIVRAIEIYLLTGTTITEHDRITAARPKRYDAARIVLNYADRADLYARIDARVDAMEQAGLVDEVRALLASGLSPDCTAMQAIGYKEIAAFLEGKTTEHEAAATPSASSRGSEGGRGRCASSGIKSRIWKKPATLRQSFYTPACIIMPGTRMTDATHYDGAADSKTAPRKRSWLKCRKRRISRIASSIRLEKTSLW